MLPVFDFFSNGTILSPEGLSEKGLYHLSAHRNNFLSVRGDDDQY